MKPSGECMTDLRTAALRALEALETDAVPLNAINNAAAFLRAALARPEPCRYPDCVDNGPEGKCTRWLLDECSKSSDFKPHRSAEPVRGPVAGPAKSVHDKVYSEVELADAYQKGWNHAMLRRSLGPHGIKEGA
jgi:hypothetical protein